MLLTNLFIYVIYINRNKKDKGGKMNKISSFLTILFLMIALISILIKPSPILAVTKECLFSLPEEKVVEDPSWLWDHSFWQYPWNGHNSLK